ncbi:MAG: hypothetical protein EBU70_09065, partial [Actinobacteria bacterium]|nr:hypothetical protein [Actinomycetota bacterium]
MRTFVASLTLAIAPLALADAEGHAPLGGRVPQVPSTPTLSEVSGFDIIPAPALVLPDQDLEAFVAEDELDRGGPKAL